MPLKEASECRRRPLKNSSGRYALSATASGRKGQSWSGSGGTVVLMVQSKLKNPFTFLPVMPLARLPPSFHVFSSGARAGNKGLPIRPSRH